MMIAFGMLDRMDVVLAERIGLTACDAGYLWLARRMSAELATLDRQLEAARAMD